MVSLLSTDFDGTLIDWQEPTVDASLFAWLAALRRHGVLWALNTGRDLEFALEGLHKHGFPMEPDFLLTNERAIYRRTMHGTWEDYGDWNSRCEEDHQELFLREAPLLERMWDFLHNQTAVELIYEKGLLVGFLAQDEEEMNRVAAHFQTIRPADSLCDYQRNTLYWRFCHAHYSKGSALAELCRLLRIGRENVVAAGDHHNDLSMLDGLHARWPIAPSNAIAEIQHAVRKAGGYVAATRCSRGVVEGLAHLFGGKGIAPKGFPGELLTTAL